MKRLDNLSEIASRQLGGLEATPTLLAKIKLEAADRKQPRTMRAVLRPALAVCAALVLCVGAVMTLSPDGSGGLLPVPTQNVLDSHSAGNQMQPTAEPRTLGDVPGVEFRALVPNLRGVQRAADCGCKTANSRSSRIILPPYTARPCSQRTAIIGGRLRFLVRWLRTGNATP